MTYQEKKEKARQIAMDWQENFSDMYMSEYAQWCDYFYRLGKRYGLLTEFRENAIPC